MYYSFLKTLLFLLPPETAHAMTLKSLRWLYNANIYPHLPLLFNQPKTVMGISFPNQIGLGAGLDKNGDYINTLAALGFGFIEVGTVTPIAQLGNPNPRLFRLPQAQALINRMGFNNCGVNRLILNIKKAHFKGILAINIGKNATTPLEEAVIDYTHCLKQVYPYASYISINISSPNTEDLRQLQKEKYLDNLLENLKKTQLSCCITYQKYVPLVVKISPDLFETEIKSIADLLLFHKIDGLIATNTTTSREDIKAQPYLMEKGGLSGQPLFKRSLAIVSQFKRLLGNQIPIIGCGGIGSAEQARQMYEAGASLLQIYTSLIYKGPGLIKTLAQVKAYQE